jgi:hypothetical protein
MTMSDVLGMEVLDQNRTTEFDFTKGGVSQNDLLKKAAHGMVLSFEVIHDQTTFLPWLVVYFGANSIKYRVPRLTAFVKCPLHGTVQQSLDFIETFSELVAASWLAGIGQDKVNARILLTK